jgi:hypothetical protein
MILLYYLFNVLGTIVMHFASQQPAANNSTNAQQQRRQLANHEHQILQLFKKVTDNRKMFSKKRK